MSHGTCTTRQTGVLRTLVLDDKRVLTRGTLVELVLAIRGNNLATAGPVVNPVKTTCRADWRTGRGIRWGLLSTRNVLLLPALSTHNVLLLPALFWPGLWLPRVQTHNVSRTRNNVSHVTHPQQRMWCVCNSHLPSRARYLPGVCGGGPCRVLSRRAALRAVCVSGFRAVSEYTYVCVVCMCLYI